MKWEIIKKFSAENRSCFGYKDQYGAKQLYGLLIIVMDCL
jgi:hypothetical protein